MGEMVDFPYFDLHKIFYTAATNQTNEKLSDRWLSGNLDKWFFN